VLEDKRITLHTQPPCNLNLLFDKKEERGIKFTIIVFVRDIPMSSVCLNTASHSSRVRPMTAGRRRPPQDTIFSDILGTTKDKAAINHDVNQCKAVTNLFQVQF